MRSVFACFTLFLVLMHAGIPCHARKDVGEYWRQVMKEQPMPKAVEGLLHEKLPISNDAGLEEKEKPLVNDVKPDVTFWIYDDLKPDNLKSASIDDDLKSKLIFKPY